MVNSYGTKDSVWKPRAIRDFCQKSVELLQPTRSRLLYIYIYISVKCHFSHTIPVESDYFIISRVSNIRLEHRWRREGNGRTLLAIKMKASTARRIKAAIKNKKTPRVDFPPVKTPSLCAHLTPQGVDWRSEQMG